MSKERLNAIEATLARIEANMATRADLASAIASVASVLADVARNVEITALGRQLREMQDELRVTSVIVLRLDHVLPDITQQLNAMVRQQIGIIDRLRALEDEEPR